MSEMYQFKAMSQVELLEEPADSATVLAVENGSVRQIPILKIGGGGGSYVVRGIIDPEAYSVSADKTYSEIVAAVESGCVPTLCLEMGNERNFIPLLSMTEEYLLFQVYMAGQIVGAQCGAGNTWTLILEEA